MGIEKMYHLTTKNIRHVFGRGIDKRAFVSMAVLFPKKILPKKGKPMVFFGEKHNIRKIRAR